MKAQSKKIFLIAGETSADALGAWLINQIKHLYPNVDFVGVGCTRMKEAGQRQILDGSELCYFGALEILGSLRKIVQQRRNILEAIAREQPHVLVTIDLPDFNFSIGKVVKRIGIPVIHVGAPTVWAWRPQRAKKIAQFLSHLLCLFPFEPVYFTRHGLQTSFIGHPIMHQLDLDKHLLINSQEKSRSSYPTILLLPGSRLGEIKRLLPILVESARQIRTQIPKARFVTTVTDNVEGMVEKCLQDKASDLQISIVPQKQKYTIMKQANLAIASSGTVTLDLAYAKTPMVIIYKLNTLSGWVAKFLLQTKVVGLPNIILGKKFIPELLQSDCKVSNIVEESLKLLQDAKLSQQQCENLERVKERLKIDTHILEKSLRKAFDPYMY